MPVDYLIIILAVVAFAAQFAFTKVFEGSTKQTTATTLLMLIVTNITGALMFFFIGAFGGMRLEFSWFSLMWAVVLGLVMIPYYMIGIRVLSYGSLAIYSMFMMLGGMLVPFVYGLFIGESMTWGKAVGTVVLTVCIILQAVWQSACEGGSKKKGKVIFLILCLAVFFVNGATGVIANVHQSGAEAISEVHFTVISCGVTAIVSAAALLVLFLFGNKKEKKKEIRSTFSKRPFLAMIAIGAAAYTGSFLILKAASNVPASVQFPLVSGGVIVLSALVSAFIFKEKLTKKEWICIAGAFASTFLFAF